MKRRDFGRMISAGAAGTIVSQTESVHSASWRSKKALMHVGTQQFTLSDKDLQFLERHGVKSKADHGTFLPGYGWKLDDLLKRKEKCAEFGVNLEMIALPVSQLNVDGGSIPNFMLGNKLKGAKEIDLICDMIRTTAKAGIPAIKYYLCAMENQRTESTPAGRGGARYSTWDLEEARNRAQRFEKPVTAEENWEHISDFLKRVIPVATEYKIRMACHPCDPWLPPGYRGVDRVLGGAEGLKRFIDISPSPYHGVNLCLGCMAESVEDPANEVPEIIRYFGKQKKIFLIHYRNIIGRRNKFLEVYPDNGVMNMHRIMQVLKEVEYPHMIVPDHVPYHPDDPGGLQAFAFAFGYIKAMIQAVNE